MTIAPVRGIRVVLRLVEPNDAEYIFRLRTDPEHSRHLSQVIGTAVDQRNWLERYKKRELAGLEYYYVIERSDGSRCGLVRLYNITKESFTWGSWILDRNKPEKAALESAVLSFGVGFVELGLEKAVFDVRRANAHASAFYRRFGAVETGQDAENIYFEMSRDEFLRKSEEFQRIIEVTQ